jgi:hypothetical protein
VLKDRRGASRREKADSIKTEVFEWNTFDPGESKA